MGVDGWAQADGQTDSEGLNQTHRQAENQTICDRQKQRKRKQRWMEGGKAGPPPRSRHALAVLIIKSEVASSIKFYTVNPRCENNSSSPLLFFSFFPPKDVIYDIRHRLSAPIPSMFDLQLGPLSLILMYGSGHFTKRAAAGLLPRPAW